MNQPIITCPDEPFYCTNTPVPMETSGGLGIPEWVVKSQPSGSTVGLNPGTGTTTSFTGSKPGVYEVCAQWTEDLPDIGDCAGEPILLEGFCPSGAIPSQVTWSAAPPNPGTPYFFSPNQIETYAIFPNAGTYNVQMECCIWLSAGALNEEVAVFPIENTNIQNPNVWSNSFLTCPRSVRAGETFNVYLYGCEGYEVAWTVTGNGGGATTNLVTGSTVATALTDTGVVSVEAVCTDPASGAVATYTCEVPIIPFDETEIKQSETAEIEVVVNDCGSICVSAVKTITVLDCERQECVESYITIRVGENC